MGEGTSTQPPKSRRRIIERPRLTRLLDESPARIKMLIAPAGYGKTTLARQWVEASDSRIGWCTCTSESRDVVVVLAQVQRALLQLGVSIERTIERAQSASNPLRELDALLDLLVQDVGALREDSLLVVDDYHELIGSAPAERVIEALISRTSASYLIASRRRPSWATARRLLYGDVAELRRSRLAMTAAEVEEVLTPHQHGADSIAAAAHGWPAFVGLAASRPELRVPTLARVAREDELYEYLATEIYAAASPDLQGVLRTVSFASSGHAELIHQLMPERGPRLESEAADLGFLTDDGAHGRELHPLLQEFLRRRCREAGELEVRRAFDTLWTIFVRSGRWDDAFSLTVLTGILDALPDLVRASLDEMLAAARLVSLERWVAFAASRGVEHPMLSLADAELALRRGGLLRAQGLACEAASMLGDDPDHAARAWCVAGRAAHLRAADDTALAFFEHALASEAHDRVRREAAWGRFVAAVDLELPESDHALAYVVNLEADPNPEALVRRWNAQLLYELRVGDLISANEASSAAAVVDRVKDPVKRAGFWSAYTNALTLTGLYGQALSAADAFVADAQRFRVDFALPYAYQGRAAALAGMRRYDEANEELNAADRTVNRAPDAHVAANAQAIRARMLASQGRYDEALGCFREIVDPLSRGMQGELLATRALVRACIGDGETLRDVETAASSTRSIEARVLSRCARAILASVTADADLRAQVCEAIDAARESRNVDGLVTAYRAHPSLLDAVDPADARVDWLRALLERVGDRELAATLERPRRGTSALTPREAEIHALLAEALTNKEIAAKLFLSEATVKLHVHHVLEKLGVRTRTAAARLFMSQRTRP